MDDEKTQSAPLAGDSTEPMTDETTATTAETAEEQGAAQAPEEHAASQAPEAPVTAQTQAPLEEHAAPAVPEEHAVPQAPEAPVTAQAEAAPEEQAASQAPEAPVAAQAEAPPEAPAAPDAPEAPLTAQAEVPSEEQAAPRARETSAAPQAETPSEEQAAPQAEAQPSAPTTRQGQGKSRPKHSPHAPAPAPAGEAARNGETDMASLLASSDEQFRQLKYGDVIEGTIMRKDPDEILVDIGFKSEGVIPSNELTSLSPTELADLSIGDEVLVSVLQPEDKEGHVVLSLDRARQERSWRTLQKQFENNEVIEAEVNGYNKGGLLVNLEGVRGFVPASQVTGLSIGGSETTKQSELSRFSGQKLPLKIIEINRNRNRLILSERQAAQEQRDARKEQLLAELTPNQVREGRVSSICDFGAFVDIGGADGLIHLSELSWSRVTHPSEVLKVGQTVQVYVINVDERDHKIGLSLKRTQPEPWTQVMEHYQLGQLVRGTITQLTDFGAFARLEDGIEGLIHVSELAEGRVTHPRNVVQEGWELILRVIRIDQQRRRMGLSLKRAMEAQEGDTMEPQGALPTPTPRAAEGVRGGGRGGRGRGEQAAAHAEEAQTQAGAVPTAEPSLQPPETAHPVAAEESQTAMAQAMNAARDTQTAEAESAAAETESAAPEATTSNTAEEPAATEATPYDLVVAVPDAAEAETETTEADTEAAYVEPDAAEAQTEATDVEPAGANEAEADAGDTFDVAETEAGAAEAPQAGEAEPEAGEAETAGAEEVEPNAEPGEATDTAEIETADAAEADTKASAGETAEAGADVNNTEAVFTHEAEPTSAEPDAATDAEPGSDAKHGETDTEV
ncbi:MAG: 30S ribosomal protein S1 [Chloroflexia bacterium]